MSFVWPVALLGLVVLPLLAGLWWWSRRRRRRDAIVLPSVRLVRAAQGSPSRARRWVPASLLVLGVIAASVAVARPQTTVDVASSEATVLLALDVSSSMCTTDVDPNRLVAAQEAAVDFIEAQEESVAIGVVAFASSAALVSEPTTDREALVDAVESLTTSRGTAIGQAILTSIDGIAMLDSDVDPTGVETESDDEGDDAEETYAPETIVVLTDGSNSVGVDPVTAAEEAAARGLRVYTIGFGTTESAASVCDVSQVDTDDLNGGTRGGGGGQSIDVATLQEVADLTGGEYFAAENADELQQVLLDLPEVVAVQQEQRDVGSWFAGAAALLIGAGLALSWWWGRVRRA